MERKRNRETEEGWKGREGERKRETEEDRKRVRDKGRETEGER